jgi:hypothetical protein
MTIKSTQKVLKTNKIGLDFDLVMANFIHCNTRKSFFAFSTSLASFDVDHSANLVSAFLQKHKSLTDKEEQVSYVENIVFYHFFLRT